MRYASENTRFQYCNGDGILGMIHLQSRVYWATFNWMSRKKKYVIFYDIKAKIRTTRLSTCPKTQFYRAHHQSQPISVSVGGIFLTYLRMFISYKDFEHYMRFRLYLYSTA